MEYIREGRVCIECEEWKPYSEFHKNKASPDGYQNRCKVCRQRIYYEKYKDKKVLYDKLRYSKLDKEKVAANRRKNYLKNKERDLAKAAEYREKNIEVIKKQNRKNAISNAVYLDNFDRLTVEESPRLSKDGRSLEVRCRYCGKYFIPTKRAVSSRIRSLEGKTKWEGSLYCSNGCKQACPIYGKHKYPRGYKKATSREVQPQLRQMVLERDNWECQKCGKTVEEVELHCHHILPINEAPIESADVDNCITLCKECHKLSHKLPDCDYNSLRCGVMDTVQDKKDLRIMDKDLTIFENEEFGKLTVVEKNGEPWFVAKEIADALEYTATNKMTRRLDDDEKTTVPFRDIGSNYQTNKTVINESGFYNAVIGSKKPEAKRFKKWVTSEVLPTIRKTGGYMVEHPEDTPEEIMARALKIADYTLKRREERLNQLEAKIELDAPKVEFAEAVEATESSIDVSAFANVLGIEQLGRNKLYAWFRTKGYLRENKEPYRKYIERGYFDVVEVPVNRPFFKSINIKPLITPKGQVYFTKKLKDCFTV